MPTSHLPALFVDASQAGVFTLAHAAREAVLACTGECLVLTLDLGQVHNRQELLATVGGTLRCPEWFAADWTTLNDRLGDLGWLPASAYVVVITQCETLRAHAEGEFQSLLHSMRAAARRWRNAGVPFWCLVDASVDTLPPLLLPLPQGTA